MRKPLLTAAAAGLWIGVMAAPASAQYGARPVAAPRAIGETYHVEVFGGFWSPSPDITISSEALGIVGSDIDFVQDLGIEKKRFGDLRIVLRPTTKSKFRIGYTPVTYSATKVLTRDIVFNGQRYRVSLPVDSELSWKQWRFGYEWDFVYRERGFAGLILDVKYIDMEATLSSRLVGSEFTHAKAPIPSIGGVGRVYVSSNTAITFELTALKVPKIEEKYEAVYVDWDLNGTFNYNDHIGGQIGFRNLNVDYLFDKDVGDMVLRGLYFGAVARF